MVSVTLSSLPMFTGVLLTQLEVRDQRITLQGASTATSAACPECAIASTRVHSTYTRTLADVPWSGWAVRLHLHVRRFFCRTTTCSRTTFVEQIPDLTRPYAQHTIRMNELLGSLGLALGGEAGHRMSRRLAVPVSADTLLRRVRRLPLPPSAAPTTIGVDEWAKRKGRQYGAIVVDLERHQVLDLLSDDTAEQFAAWLHAHPDVEVIARDRAHTFARGATQGAPHAQQVADRWHLMHNIGDALETLLQRHARAVRAAADDLLPDPPLGIAASARALLADHPHAAPAPMDAPPTTPGQSPEVDNARHTVPVWPQGHSYGPADLRLEQFQRAKALRAQGWSYRRIAQELQIQRRTARKYAEADEVPQRILPQTTSSLAPYAALIRLWVAAGATSGTGLYQELQAQGYRGSLSSVYRALRHLLPGDQRQRPRGQRRHLTRPPVALRQRRSQLVSPRQARWCLVRPPEQRTAVDVAYRERLCALCPEVAIAYPLVQRFLRLIRNRDSAALDPWLVDAHASGVPEFQRFARSLRRDTGAVRAAPDTPWSTGQVEGQINRLKLVKRMMYGRGGFELLRRRVILAV